MPIDTKDWVDAPSDWAIGDALPSGATPIDADALVDLETRMGAYADALVTAETVTRLAADTALDARVDTLEAAPAIVMSQAQPVAPTKPTLWIALDVDDTPLPVTEWGVFIP